ncbi:hypothetical protein [Streptomyces sp. NBC_01443]|uniref:hypothetical protein n=1 Tax=Streptomyces sp. NBC_01443 TaxID=2903868 RepID=UPI00225201D9|nr:hypothetical protein [Streptomyces sp. NBC_01443]MCX4625355.1 hypothetical protein [Streptomyces sp. NBC_01443]
MSTDIADEERERLALTHLCERLPDLRAAIPSRPVEYQTLLTAIETAARSRTPIADQLEQLIRFDVVRSDRRLPHEMPFGPGHADEEIARCPDNACSRTERPRPAGVSPRCRVTGERMPNRSTG